MADLQELAAMRQALACAVLGPAYGPNPRVGCVVLDAAGRVIAEGHHRGAGTAHAEVDALSRAGDAARGGTAVVTLEPCNHTGRTGPCTRALIAAGVRRVVIGASDPHAPAAGGAVVLADAGIEVETGVLVEESEQLNRYFLHAVRAGRPFVTWKYAATLDGRSAAADGTSRWITGPQARADVHRRRAAVDAVLVGTGTALADNPRLTARDELDQSLPRQPLRVVMGRRALPPGAHLLDGSAPTVHLSTHEPQVALAALVDREVRHLWLEGGPTLAAAFLAAGVVDEVLAYVAPALLGAGPAAVADLGVGTVADTLRLEFTGVHQLGDDVLLVARPCGKKV